jgi:hypothetical protein
VVFDAQEAERRVKQGGSSQPSMPPGPRARHGSTSPSPIPAVGVDVPVQSPIGEEAAVATSMKLPPSGGAPVVLAPSSPPAVPTSISLGSSLASARQRVSAELDGRTYLGVTPFCR